jgi:hypothetical protein
MTAQHFYKRPTLVRLRMYDPLVKAVVMHTWWSGFSRRDSVQVLAVRGRKTGRLYLHPVGICSYLGEKYIISFYGDSQWARNLRAGMDAELRDRKSARPIKGIELAGEEKLEFLRFLLDQYPMIIRVWWKLSAKRATSADLDMLADRYPIFRVAAA